MKRRVLAAVGATGALLCATVALAVGGGSEDPLVSKSYVDGTYTAQMVEQAEAAVAKRHDALYADAEAGLKDKQEGYLAQLGGGTSGGSYQAAFSDIRVKEGVERGVCDYISGMTDKYAVEKFGALFIPASWSVK